MSHEQLCKIALPCPLFPPERLLTVSESYAYFIFWLPVRTCPQSSHSLSNISSVFFSLSSCWYQIYHHHHVQLHKRLLDTSQSLSEKGNKNRTTMRLSNPQDDSNWDVRIQQDIEQPELLYRHSLTLHSHLCLFTGKVGNRKTCWFCRLWQRC